MVLCAPLVVGLRTYRRVVVLNLMLVVLLRTYLVVVFRADIYLHF